jgi:RHS repeat-associated protein
VFDSGASNLVPQTAGTTSVTNVYLRDTQTNTTRLVSVDATGTVAVGGSNAVLTPDGGHVAWVSSSTNVPSDVAVSSAYPNVYLSTITATTITTKLVSVNRTGTDGGDAGSGVTLADTVPVVDYPQVSADGRFVAFASGADDLAPGVTDAPPNTNGAGLNVYVRDLQTGVTRAASAPTGGTTTGDQPSFPPVLSADGGTVAFVSEADNLVRGDTNFAPDVFVRDLAAGATELASRRSPLLPAAFPGAGRLLAASPDGRFVVFSSDSQLGGADTFAGVVPGHSLYVPGLAVNPGNTVLYERDTQTGSVQPLSVQPDGKSAGTSADAAPVRADGRFVAFTSADTDLDATVHAPNGGVYLRDLVTGVTHLLSRNPATCAVAGAFSFDDAVAVSADGRFIAFTSSAGNLVNGLTVPAGQSNLYLADRQAGTLTMVSRNAAGTAPGGGMTPESRYQPSFSGDGSKLVFVSDSSDLVPGVTDTNGGEDVFACDTATGKTDLVSVATTPNTAAGGNFDGGSNLRVVSSNGQSVVFTSLAADLVAAGGNGLDQVYVRDLVHGTTRLVSGVGPDTLGDGNSFLASISTDGSHVAFTSQAANLSAPGTNGSSQVYVRDLAADAPQLVSVNAAGTAGGNADSGARAAQLNGECRYVFIPSVATDLVPNYVAGHADGLPDLYLRDLQTGTTVLVNANQSGTASGNGGEAGPDLLAGNTLLFQSPATDLVTGDHAPAPGKVYAYTFAGAGSIAGTVFNDTNGNGTQDAGEAGIPYWTVYLDANGNGRLDPGEATVRTGASGHYRFTGLPAGTYTVAFVPDDGYQRTAPAGAAGTQTVTLATAMSAVTGINFGARQSPVDLAVASVSAPTSAQPGQDASVSWVVRYAGDSSATGGWQDAVYLSSGPTVDANSVLLATVPRGGGLASATAYTGSTTVTLPGTPPGDYYFVVVTDRRYQVSADNNRANNLLSADTPTAVTIPALTAGTPATGTFTGAEQSRYFQLAPAQGQTLTLTLTSVAVGGDAELYVNQFHPPTEGTFDFAAQAVQPNQTLTIPTAGPGPYFVLVRSRSGAAAAARFTLTVATAGLGLTGIDTPTGGNTGQVTLAVHGTGLTPATQVRLVSGATTVPATSTSFGDGTTLYATFDLTGKAAGAYDVRAQDGTHTAALPGAFTVTAGQANPVQITLVAPDTVREEHQTSILVEYTNTGNTDVPAPLLQLTATNAKLRLEDQPDFSGDFSAGSSVQFLGIASDGPAGVLRPGHGGSVRVILQTPFGQNTQIVTTVRQLASTSATIDWASLKDGLRPSDIPADAWNAIYANFTAAAGTTTGQFQQLLGAQATALGEVGEPTPDVGRLVEFALQQANGGIAGVALAADTDVSHPAPGLALVFQRQYLQTIAGRYRTGPLGRGWVDNWEISAGTDSLGNATIAEGPALRFFTKQADGSYRAAPGDHGTLSLVNGAYMLREPNGTLLAFNPDGTLDYEQDGNGNRITAGYTNGRLTTLTHSDGDQITIGYDTQGLIASVTGPGGKAATYTYDASGQHLIGTTDRYGTTTWSYLTGQANPALENALSEIAYPDGTHTFFGYDSQGRVVDQHRDNGQQDLTYTYGAPGGFSVTDSNGGRTTYLVDDSRQVGQVTGPLGDVATFRYDANGNLVQEAGLLGTTSTYAYDAQGDLASRTDPLGNQATFTYDASHHLLGSQDPRGNTTSQQYDANGNLLSVAYADGSGQQFQYDPLGDLTETTDGRGQVLHYAYYGNGLLKQKTYADGLTVSYQYDARGNLTQATDQAGNVTTLKYDNAGDLEEIDSPGGRFLKFRNGASGRRLGSIDQAGFTVDYTYDAAGRLSKLTDGNNNLVASYTYDAAGRLVEKDLGNGTYTTYQYDQAGNLLHLVNHAPRPEAGQDGPPSSRFDYTYGALGQVTTETTSDGQWAYSYDAAGQLTHAVFTSNDPAAVLNQDLQIAYDAAGNRVKTTDNGVTFRYVANARNQYTQVGDTSYTYDADGNVATMTDATGTTHYSFDQENRLTAVTAPADSFSYQYDPLGQQVAATHDGRITRFVVDPIDFGNVVGEYGDNGLSAYYTYGLGLVSRVDAAGGAAYYDFDQAGSTAGLTDATGHYVNRYDYLPFGETAMLSAGLPNPFQNVGQWGVMAMGSGLDFMRARSYAVGIGCFSALDPLRFGGGDVNLYTYVQNAPVGSIDPLGTFGIPGGLVGAAVGAAISGAGYILTSGLSGQGVAGAGLAGALASGALYGGFIGATGGVGGDVLLGARTGALGYGIGLLDPHNKFDPKDLIGATVFGGVTGPLGRFNLYGLRDVNGAVRPWNLVDYNALINGLYKSARWSTALNTAYSTIIHAIDPNDLVGPGGFGTARFLVPGPALPYAIDFQNQPSATAPAQEVTVTQQLDANLDWTTFQLGDITFGSQFVSVPAGRQSFQARIRYHHADGSPLFVDVGAGLNVQTGVVTWTFRSVDPATGLLPEAALAGFLPPDDSQHDGEGSVSYTARPKANVATGTTVNAQASVVLDTNAPLATNTFANTFDTAPPSTSVSPLPAVIDATSIPVSWSGSDGAGSGIKSYDVYVSAGGGAFTPWLIGTTQTSATYQGDFGHSYAFYSVATDNDGLRQATPGAAQAVTALQAPPPPGPQLVHDVTAQVRITRVKNRRHGRSRLTLMLQNVGGADLDGPLSLVFGKLPRKVKLRTSTGVTRAFGPAGRPYLDVIPSGGTFQAGATRTVTLVFAGPGSASPKHMPEQVLAGLGQR